MMDYKEAQSGLASIWKRSSTFERKPYDIIKPGYWSFVTMHIIYKNLPIIIASGAFLIALSK